MESEPQVKSLTLVALRELLSTRFVEERGGPALTAVWSALEPDTFHEIQSADIAGWASERTLNEVMRTVFDVGFEGDRDAYVRFVMELSGDGINRFLKIILSLMSARFVLLRVPAVWAHLRRNSARVTAERAGEGIRVRYDGFPFFGHEAYRLLSLANCQALVLAATGDIPQGRVVEWSEDTLELFFEL